MKSDCYFDECKDCLYRECNNDLIGCLSNRLGLAWHRLIKELPLINKFADDYRYCHWYQKDAVTKEQPTHWTLGYGLDAELGFDDGRYLPRKAALILYPEYFDENDEPIFDMLPIGKVDKE